MLRHIGIIVALGFVLASAFMNYLFGHGFGRTPLEAQVYGFVGILAVAANALCPFFGHAAYEAKRLATFYAVTGLWILCLAYSMTSALGFAAESRDALSVPRAAQHDILRTKQQTLQELEARKRTLAIETRIHVLREEINTLRAQGALRDPDPQSAMLAKLVGLDRQSARTVLLLLFALMIEVGAAIGLFAALSTTTSRPVPVARAQKPNGQSKVWNPSLRSQGAERRNGGVVTKI